MLISILLIIIILIFPIIIEVNSQMIEDNNDQRHNLLFQIFVILQCIIAIPIYYFLLLKELFLKFKNK
jgi:uncharacterized membrane protein YjgN (DUF898 family)